MIINELYRTHVLITRKSENVNCGLVGMKNVCGGVRTLKPQSYRLNGGYPGDLEV